MTTTTPDALPKRKLIWRILLPPPFHDPPRDLVAEQRQRSALERAAVLGLVAYVPIAGILLVAANLLIQVRGYQGLAVAILENLSLGSLALVVVSNLMTLALCAFVLACTRVLGDRTFAASVRRTAGFLAFVGIIVSLFVLSWLLAALLAVLTYLSWRIRIGTVVNISSWLKGGPPSDEQQLLIWLEGRRRMRADGQVVPAIQGLTEPAVSNDPRDLNSISDAVNQRIAAIRAATPRTVYSAIAAGLLAVIPIYGYNAVLVQLQFAPLEKVTFAAAGKPHVGYVFSTEPGSGIFVPKSMDSATFLDQHPLKSRELCAYNYSAGSIFTVAKKSTGADCS